MKLREHERPAGWIENKRGIRNVFQLKKKLVPIELGKHRSN
jgi:hypothetical protein